MPRTLIIHASFLIVAALATAASADTWAPWPFHKDDPVGKPDKVVAVWTDAVATVAGQLPVRGFGGRLMFYEGANDMPVRVDGTLIVYIFDETNRDPNNSKPDCKYVFTSEQLPKHYSKSKLGHSYSVWVPWDQAGGLQKHFTLVVRFEPKNGAPVIGEQCKEMLPGLAPPAKPDPTRLPAGYPPAAYPPAAYPPAVGGPPGTMAGIPANYGPNYGVSGVNLANYNGPTQATSGVRQAAFETPQPQFGPQFGPQYNTRAAQVSQDRRMTTTTIAVPDGLAVQRALSAPQAVPPAAQQPAPNPANQWPAANSARQSAPAPNSNPSNLPPRQAWPQQADLRLGRPWVPNEQLARLNRDRAPSPPSPSAPQLGPENQPLGPSPNGVPAATPGVPQAQ
jgi:hypothetical protein